MPLDFTLVINPSDGTFQLPPFNSQRLTYEQTSDGGGNPGKVTVTTSEITLSFGSVTPGVVVLYNVDDTNYVEWGYATGVYGGRLQPRKTTANKGVPAVFVLNPGASVYLKADTASCDVYAYAWDA